MRAFLVSNERPVGDKAGLPAIFGVILPYWTKTAFPAFFFDDVFADMERVPAPVGMVGADVRGNLMVVDSNGDAHYTGMRIPDKLVVAVEVVEEGEQVEA